jgi:L-alanine-DL-glutamate epimerase-like enolase superfamily enzyme
MKITEIELIAHQLKRKVRWQTASYNADSLLVFFVKIHCDNGLTGIGAASIMPTPKAAISCPVSPRSRRRCKLSSSAGQWKSIA